MLFHYFALKEDPTKTYRMLSEAYSEVAPSKTTCKEWFQRFKSGDFKTNKVQVSQKSLKASKCKHWRMKIHLKYTIKKLAEALNATDRSISKRQHAMRKIHKEGKWAPHELTDVRFLIVFSLPMFCSQ